MSIVVAVHFSYFALLGAEKWDLARKKMRRIGKKGLTILKRMLRLNEQAEGRFCGKRLSVAQFWHFAWFHQVCALRIAQQPAPSDKLVPEGRPRCRHRACPQGAGDAVRSERWNRSAIFLLVLPSAVSFNAVISFFGQRLAQEPAGPL